MTTSDELFGDLRKDAGTGRALFIRFKRQRGDSFRFPYSYLSEVYSEGSEKLMLTFAGRQVLVEGRSLDVLEERISNNTLELVEEGSGRGAAGFSVTGIQVRTIGEVGWAEKFSPFE